MILYLHLFIMFSWNLAKVTQGETSFKLGLSEMVSIDSATPNYSGLGLYSMVIAKKSAVKQAAYVFSKFLATDKTFQMAFAKVKSLLPVTSEALSDDYYAKDQYLSYFATQLTKVAPRPGTPVWSTLEQQIVNMFQLGSNESKLEILCKGGSNADTFFRVHDEPADRFLLCQVCDFS